jgi:hypothetical protein
MPAGITSIKFVPRSQPPPIVWSPTDVAGCTLWLDPTYEFVNNTTWTDRITSAIYTYQGGGGDTAVSGTSINGNASIDIAGSGYFTSFQTLNQVLSGSPDTSWTCLTVFVYTGSVTDFTSNGGSSNPAIIADSDEDWWQAVSTTTFRSTLWVVSNYSDVATITTSTNYYVISRFIDTNANGGFGPMQINVNGGGFDTGINSQTYHTGGTSMQLLRAPNGGSPPFIGSIGDIIVWNSALDSTDIANAVTWAHNRYGI